MKSAKKGGRGNPAGPSHRGRRGHSTIEEQEGFPEWLNIQLSEVPRPTYAEVMDRLKGTTFTASRSALARYDSGRRERVEEAEKFAKLQKEVAALKKRVKALEKSVREADQRNSETSGD